MQDPSWEGHAQVPYSINPTQRMAEHPPLARKRQVVYRPTITDHYVT